MRSYRAANVFINLDALKHNFQQVKIWAPNSYIMPVIKSNAYGHGILQVAETLTQADGFAVAQISEAQVLRDNGIKKPIAILQGFSNISQLNDIIKQELRPVISQHWQLDLLESLMQNLPIDIWVKINTGMGRLGFSLSDAPLIFQRLEKIKFINKLGLMMHFANADEPQHISNQKQIEHFVDLSKQVCFETSASNSAAIISGLLTEQDWVRPGIMLYGASPIQGKTASELQLKPVMRLTAELIALNQLKQGQTVGYGDVWVCPEDMPIGIVNIGYGDGYPRHAHAAPIAVNGQRCKTIGRVSMDSIAVDLRGIQAQCGDMVECWGEKIAVDEVAACADTIAYELLCNVG